MPPPQHRVIVLTGATRGLGRALVPQLVCRGHTVVGCGRNPAEVESLGRAHGAPHSFSVVDVASDAEVMSWAARALADHGPPDLLINNAALMNDPAPLWEVPASQFDALLRVNLGGIANVVRHFVPPMVARGRGVILNVSSGWGRVVSPQVAPYCATKWGVEGLSRALAAELPPGMASIPVNPGIINTDMLRTCWADDALTYPEATAWAEVAADFLLGLGPAQSGKTQTVPL